MSYVDAFYDRHKDVIRVVERTAGKRILVDHKPEYNFYIPDPRGNHRSIYGEPVQEIRCRNIKEFRKMAMDLL